MDQHVFEKVKDQVGACGIWCGSCAVGNGSLREAGIRYADVIEGHGLKHWAPPELDYEGLIDGLSIVSDIAACTGCLQGGGRDGCEMKRCAAGRGLSECAACDEAACPHTEILQHMRTGAVEAGLFVKTEPGNADAWIAEKMRELPKQFPSCLLFLEETS